MKLLNMSINIDPQFTAEDWQLYSESMECTVAAAKLNAKLKQLVNCGLKTRGAIESEMLEMHKLMCYHKKYGAAYSEPYWFLEQILNECFGEE